LRNFMSLTDANGYTGRGEMFVCSWKQLKCLIPTLAEENNGDLLDIGAGDGNITAKIASHYNRIVTTESSTVMQKKLRARGWECYEPEAVPWNDMKYKFNLVMCLNVLDRADKPLTLLRDLRGMVKPGTGRLLLAVVLPWCAFVESGNKQMQPTGMSMFSFKGSQAGLQQLSYRTSVLISHFNIKYNRLLVNICHLMITIYVVI